MRLVLQKKNVIFFFLSVLCLFFISHNLFATRYQKTITQNQNVSRDALSPVVSLKTNAVTNAVDNNKKNYQMMGLPEMAWGNPQAPIHIDMLFCMTCTHCAEFYKTTLKDIKKDYIDTGLVYWTFQQFPLDHIALKAAMVSYCEKGTKFFEFLEAFLGQQSTWLEITDRMTLKLKNGIDTFIDVAKGQSVGEAECQACLVNQKLMDQVLELRIQAEKSANPKGLPAFVVKIPILDVNEVIEGPIKMDKMIDWVQQVEAKMSQPATSTSSNNPNSGLDEGLIKR